MDAVLIVMVYPPLSEADLMFSLNRYATTPLSIFLDSATIAIGRLMPAISVACIGASIILRRKEKSEPSFLAQFAGAVSFGITFLLAKLSGSY